MADDDDEEFSLETFGKDSEPDLFEAYRDSLSPDIKLSHRGGRQEKVAIIRTSDRITYRRCRRKWNWADSKRGNLRPTFESGPFWLGSGFHFALEDYHGYRKFEHPRDALQAYWDATRQTGIELPSDVEELAHLGKGMCDYYEIWLKNREPLNTLVINGEPQVEVNFYIEIPKEHLLPYCLPSVLSLYDRIIYSVTIDRVIVDSYNRIWTVEYKSAKQYNWFHLDTDCQVSAYAWAAHIKYPMHEIAGTIYQQHKKQLLQPPAFLGSTRMYSVSKRQKTSYALYLGALRNLYGNDYGKFPEPNRLFLDYLQEQETQDQDILIKRDYVERNRSQIDAEYQKILMETGEMLNPSLPLYPNPTRDCSWDCPFNSACVGVDAGEDWTQQLYETTMKRDLPTHNWRRFLHV